MRFIYIRNLLIHSTAKELQSMDGYSVGLNGNIASTDPTRSRLPESKVHADLQLTEEEKTVPKQ